MPEPLPEDALAAQDARIEYTYDENFGTLGRTEFQSHVLPIARGALGHHPERYEQLLRLLIEEATYCQPKEVAEFWARIQPVTFTFHTEIDSLRTPSPRSMDPSLMAHPVTHQEIDRFFYKNTLPNETKIKKNRRALTASNSVDVLAMHLAQKICQKAGNIVEDSALRPGRMIRENDQRFLSDWHIALADASGYTAEASAEEASFLHGASGMVDVYEEAGEIPVQSMLALPLTLLLPEQIQTLRAAGLQAYRPNKLLPFPCSEIKPALNVRLAQSCYAERVHLILAIKHVLLRFLSQRDALKVEKQRQATAEAAGDVVEGGTH